MLELGQLDRRHEDFGRRQVQVVAVSLEGADDARQTQADYPRLRVLADAGRGLSEAAGVVHARSSPSGGDTAAPTTVLVDRHGTVRWLYRPGEAISRLSPDALLRAIDEHLR